VSLVTIDGRGRADAAGIVRILERPRQIDLDITVFVPCLNEENAIYASLDTIRTAANQNGVSYEIHVFDDASSDTSVNEVERFSAQHPEVDILLVKNPIAQGIAENCFDSAFCARGKYHRMGWGDNVDSVDNYNKIFGNLGKADVLVVAYDVVHGKAPHRRLISNVFRVLIRLISGHQLRYFNGGSCIRTILLKRLHVESRGFGFQADLLSRLLDNGASQIELSLTSTEREGGNSKALKLRNWVSVAWMMIRLAARRIKKDFKL